MKQMVRIQRRYVTLIEIMIVMFLIALIMGVVAYNYQGSLDEGRAFATKAGIEKLETILNLAVADNPTLMDGIESNWEEVIRKSPLVQNAKALTKDGWGQPYQVDVVDGTIEVSSSKYDSYVESKDTMFGK